jgi:hypothetical protein
MIGIGARLVTLFAGNGLIVGLVVALGVMVLTWDRGRINAAVNRGVEQERAGVIQRGEINARKADSARRDAERLPTSRLCDKYARDC